MVKLSNVSKKFGNQEVRKTLARLEILLILANLSWINALCGQLSNQLKKKERKKRKTVQVSF